jgi:hypothetical protein
VGVLLVGVAIAMSGCGGSDEPKGDDDSDDETGGSAGVCDPGQTQACVGPGACQGGQRCLNDGSAWGPCDCGTPTGGAGGTGGGGTSGTGGNVAGGGTAGTSPSGGASTGGSSGATGGTGATGGSVTGGTTGTGGVAGGNGHQINLTVNYNNGALTRTLTRCYGCNSYYFVASDTAQVGFQVEDGYTQFNLQFEPNTGGTGYRVVVFLIETNMQIPSMYYGTYYEPAYLSATGRIPTADSCVEFTSLDLRAGGSVAGSLSNCAFSGGNATTPVPAVISGSFSATFRP